MSLYDLVNDRMRQVAERLRGRIEHARTALPIGYRLCEHGIRTVMEPGDFRDNVDTIRFQVTVHMLGPDERCEHRGPVTEHYPITPDKPALSVHYPMGTEAS